MSIKREFRWAPDTVIGRKNSDSEVLSKAHIDNDLMALAAAVSAAGGRRLGTVDIRY